ncbi:MAG: universal stress protein [Verrucomicrobiales bacterium]|nr:universal stress protein [Verrucomicrobiales bacterium]
MSKPIKCHAASVRRRASLRLTRIIVTTDFSEASKTALPYAAALADRLGSEVVLLNVLEPPPRLAGLENVALLQSGDATTGRLYAGLDAMAGQAFGNKTRVETHVRTGKPYREIIKAARDLEAGLLIMATHGYSGLKHAFLGSTTERVVRHAPCPVLTVRGVFGKSTGPAKPPGMRRVLLATDFSDNSAKAFPWAQAFAETFRARLTLMHVVERFPIDAMLGRELTRDTSERLVDAAQARLGELARTLSREGGPPVDPVTRFGKPFDEITRGAQELDASLIVLATHGHTGLKRVYLRSVAERVVRHAHCPVLVVCGAKR